MNGQLVEWIPSQGGTEVLELLQNLQSEVVSLRQEVADLRGENAELRRENAELRRRNLELRQETSYWNSWHRDAVTRIANLEAEVEQLRGENRQLQARLYGQKSEQSSKRDRSNQLDGEDDKTESSQQRRGQRPGRPGPQRRDYSHLPVIDDLQELPAD